MRSETKRKKSETVNLSNFEENPDNPRTITEEAFARLCDKIRAVPGGLTAMRIAYVTDRIPGKCVVLSGNTRLRVLKKLHGANADVPAEWFQDVTALDADQRRKFIVVANKSDGEWDIDKLIEQYGADELSDLGLDGLIDTAEEKAEAGDGGETVAAEKTVRNFVRAFWLVSVPIDRIGDVVDLIDALKQRGAEVDDCLC